MGKEEDSLNIQCLINKLIWISVDATVISVLRTKY